VTVELRNEAGQLNVLPEEGLAKYYASGWKTIGETVDCLASIELLPLNYKFSMTYGGGTDYRTTADPTVTFNTHNVTVELRNEAGQLDVLPEEGLAKYYASGWKTIGETVDGLVSIELLPLSYKFGMTYGGGTNYQTTDAATVTFKTKLVTVSLKDCEDNGIPTGVAKYYASGWKPFGTTDTNGETTKELLPLSYKFSMSYDGATNYITRDIAADPTVKFSATKVEIISTETVKYYASGWKTLTGPTYILPGTYKFKIGDDYYNLDISGCSLTGGFLTLTDEAGNPLSNYPADYPTETRNLKWKYRCGGSWGPESSFQTDANGQTWYSIGCSNWDKKITMTLNQTSLEQDVTVNSTFQAAKVNANLENCTGPITEVPGGSVDQGGGYWYHHGNTGLTGTVSFYTFPANIKLKMSYNHNNLTLYPTITAGTNEVDFQTTKVTFSYPGDIKSNMGGSWWMFSKPTMDLLPGDYNFWFQDGSSWYGPVTLSVSGCELSKGYVLLKMRDENGGGVPGGKATPAYGGSWGAMLPGVTDANGNLFAEIPPGFTKIKMVVNQSSTEQSTAQLLASNYTWKTEILRIWLNNHAGTTITDGAGVLDQGGGYWFNWGNLNVSGYRDIQLFPGTHKFKVTYNSTAQELFPVVGVTTGIDNFYFQTGQVISPTITQYSNGSWLTFTSGMELMPGTYTFKSPSQSATVVAGQVLNLP
jgi:hypothetical protein